MVAAFFKVCTVNTATLYPLKNFTMQEKLVSIND